MGMWRCLGFELKLSWVYELCRYWFQKGQVAGFFILLVWSLMNAMKYLPLALFFLEDLCKCQT